jgi:hypothetical protein
VGATLERIFELHDIKEPVGLTTNEFMALFSKGKIDLQLSQSELLKLFATIDTNNNGVISTAEFLEWFNKFTKPSEKELREREHRLYVLSEVNNLLSNYNLQFEKSNKISHEAESHYRKFINELVVEEADYYKGRKTILRDPFKALKIAQAKADKVIKLREKAQKSGDQDYRVIFYVDEEFCIKTNLERPEASDDVSRDVKYYEGRECLLFKDMKCKVSDDVKEWKNVQWLRPFEIVHKQGVTESAGNPEDLLPTFFAQQVETKDVNQGKLGDCWLLAALSIVAARTEYLRGNVGMTAEQLDKELSDDEVDQANLDRRLAKGRLPSNLPFPARVRHLRVLLLQELRVALRHHRRLLALQS